MDVLLPVLIWGLAQKGSLCMSTCMRGKTYTCTQFAHDITAYRCSPAGM